MGDVKDIRKDVAKETAPKVEAAPDGDPRNFTTEQLQQIVANGQDSVQEHLKVIPEMLLGLTNAAQQLGSMRMLLALKIEEESKGGN